MFSSTAGSKHSNILYSGNEHEVPLLAIIIAFKIIQNIYPLIVVYKKIPWALGAVFFIFDNLPMSIIGIFGKVWHKQNAAS